MTANYSHRIRRHAFVEELKSAFFNLKKEFLAWILFQYVGCLVDKDLNAVYIIVKNNVMKVFYNQCLLVFM